MSTETIQQNYRLQQTDLNNLLYSTSVYYPPGVSYAYSPYWMRYGLGYINDNDHYHEIGPRYRIPEELKTGVYRPNFIVGEKWPVGTYEIRWKYRIHADSPIVYQSVRFTVTTAGIYNQPGNYPDYINLQGMMQVVP